MTEQNPSQEAPVFRMQKMFIKDLSFENPNAPQIFLARNQEPKVDFNLQVILQSKDICFTSAKGKWHYIGNI